jgi:hypothetical protein
VCSLDDGRVQNRVGVQLAVSTNNHWGWPMRITTDDQGEAGPAIEANMRAQRVMMVDGDRLCSTNRQKCETWLERGNSEEWKEPKGRPSIGSGCYRVCPLGHLELKRARSSSRTVSRMKRLTLRCCSRIPALGTVNRAVHHQRPGLVMRKLMGSSAVPGPVVVCRWRSQLLLSYAVRLSMHATSTERVVF